MSPSPALANHVASCDRIRVQFPYRDTSGSHWAKDQIDGAHFREIKPETLAGKRQRQQTDPSDGYCAVEYQISARYLSSPALGAGSIYQGSASAAFALRLKHSLLASDRLWEHFVYPREQQTDPT